jgi:hypothetical protein
MSIVRYSSNLELSGVDARGKAATGKSYYQYLERSVGC